MEKRKLLISALVMSTMFLGGISNTDALVSMPKNPFSPNDSINFDITTDKLIQQYGNDYTKYFKNISIANSTGKKVDAILSKENSDALDFIGGYYINDDGIYTLQIVKDKIPTSKSRAYTTYNEIINTNELKIEFVENSYDALNKINEQIISYFTNNENTIGLLANYVDVYNNRVVVELKELSENKVNEFKNKVTNSSSVNFTKGEIKVNTGNLNPGSQVEPLIGCTVGFRAKMNNKNGYVTAGHCLKGHSEGTGINTGTIKKIRVNNTLDAAFVETYASYTPTNTLNYTLGSTKTINVTNSNPFFTTGTPVGKAGRTTGARLGKITNLNWSGSLRDFENDGASIYHTGLIETDIYNKEGDSGAPVVLYSFSSTSGDLLGIGIGGLNGGNTTFVNKISTITSGLGISRY